MAKSVFLPTFHSIVKVGDWHHTLCLPRGFPYPCGAVFAGKHWDVSMADLSAVQFHMCTLQKGICMLPIKYRRQAELWRHFRRNRFNAGFLRDLDIVRRLSAYDFET